MARQSSDPCLFEDLCSPHSEADCSYFSPAYADYDDRAVDGLIERRRDEYAGEWGSYERVSDDEDAYLQSALYDLKLLQSGLIK